VSDETIEEADRLEGAPHPREHGFLVGHAEAEASVLGAWQSGRLPHAFLIGGPEGIGKATLAYRIARFVLAHPTPDKKTRKDLSVAEDHPVSRQVAVLSHPDLLVLRRVPNDESGSCARKSGWMMCRIVSFRPDGRIRRLSRLRRRSDRRNERGRFKFAAEAGRGAAGEIHLLADFRTRRPGHGDHPLRCQRMRLNPLSTEEVSHAVTRSPRACPTAARQIPRPRPRAAAARAPGAGTSARRGTRGVPRSAPRCSSACRRSIPAKLHTLGDNLKSDQGLAVFTETVEDWLATQATRENQPPARLARYAETWEKVRRAAIDTDAFGLDRKPLVFQIFAMLADATRR
jgi:DNA polymerase-3 subunit delta'